MQHTLAIALRAPPGSRLCHYHGWCVKDGAVCIVMRKYAGTLASRISGPRPESEVIKWAAQVAQGLQALHALGLMHLDLKPDNVLCEDNGDLVSRGLEHAPVMLGRRAARSPDAHPTTCSGAGPV